MQMFLSRATAAFNPKVTLHFCKIHYLFQICTKFDYCLNKSDDPLGLDENEASFSLFFNKINFLVQMLCRTALQ